MKILLTGGAGFIGSNILKYLLNNNYEFVRVLDNLSTGFYKNIKEFEKYDNFEFIEGDITNLDICMKACQGMNVITHQAALGSVPRSINDPLSSHNNNINGFLNILLAAKKNKIKRIVYASSSSVYGDNILSPKREDVIGNQLSPYAITKYVDELYGNLFTKLYGLECIGLRYFNVFGPKQNPNGPYAAVIPKFINSLLNNKRPTINGDGSYSRDFTFVDNVVNANIKALTTKNKKAFGNIFNVSCGNEITILELFNSIKTHLNSNLEPIFGDVRIGDIPHSFSDISKIKKMLKYEVLVNYDDGLIKTIDYMKAKN